MGNIRYRKYKKILALVLAFTLSFYFVPVSNAALSSVSDDLSTLKTGIAANHTIKFTTSLGVDGPTKTITVGFTASFVGSPAAADITLTHGASTGLETSETVQATPASNVWGASYSSNTLTLTPPTDATTGEIAAADKVIITVGNNKLTNPAIGTYLISIGGVFGETGKVAVAIITNDQIPISATVDPTLTFTVANTTLALGSISTSAPTYSVGSNAITLATNAHNGYTIKVKDAGNSGNPGLYSPTIGGANGLIASTDADLSSVAGYGGQCHKTSASGSCSFALDSGSTVTGFNTTAGVTFASYGSKPAGTESYTIRVGARVSSSQEAATDYADTLTVIGTANF